MRDTASRRSEEQAALGEKLKSQLDEILSKIAEVLEEGHDQHDDLFPR